MGTKFCQPHGACSKGKNRHLNYVFRIHSAVHKKVLEKSVNKLYQVCDIKEPGSKAKN